MVMPTIDAIQQDQSALSAGHALALANEAARGLGVVLADSLVTVEQDAAASGRLWRVHFGPREFHNVRGGDVIVIVDEAAGVVQQVLRGQ